MKTRALGLFLGVLAGVCLSAPSVQAGHYTWTTSGPEVGMVRQISIDPQDPNTLLAIDGFWVPYLFRTTDGGQSWTYVDGIPGLGRVIRDPAAPQTLYTTRSDGVHKSADGGVTWGLASSGLPSVGTYLLALSPSASATLQVIAGNNPAQLFTTNDGAASWTAASGTLPGRFWVALLVDSSDAAVLYGISEQGFFKSPDGGATWSPYGTGFPNYANRLLVDPASPTTFYALTNGNGISKSTDSGATWNPANGGIESHSIRDMAFDPADPQKLYAASTGGTPSGGGGLFVSANGGASWTPVDLGSTLYKSATAVAVDPNDSSRLRVGAGAGMLHERLIDSANGGVNWAPSDAGIAGYYATSVAAHPTQSGHAYSVSFGDVYGTSSGGSSWSLLGSTPQAQVSLTVDPSNGSILYAPHAVPGGSAGGVFKSIDGGATWNDASAGLTGVTGQRLAVSRINADSLLLSTDDGVYTSADAGGLWTPRLAGVCRAVAIDSQDDQILYASRSASTGQSSFLRSSDGGVTWNPPSGVPDLSMPNDLATDPSDPSVVYAATSNHFYRSADRGLTFAPSEAGLLTDEGTIFYRFAIDPSNSQTLYLSDTNREIVYRSTNGAQSWTSLPDFLPASAVQAFSVDAGGRILYAATLGGAFHFERSFADVPDGDPFWPTVDAAAMNGVTSGCGQGNFCPANAMSRAQVAVFLLRGKNGSSYAPPPATGGVFGDVPASSFAAAWIEEIANEGITAGCGGGNYCPGAPLSRAQMAVLLLKTKHGVGYAPPAATGTVFSDVPASAFAADWIEELFAEGITSGCGGGMFCPDNPTTRAQAVTFVVRAFGLS